MPPSVPAAEHRLPTPPKAVVARVNSPSPPRVDRFSSDYNHGTSESRHGGSEFLDESESLDHAFIAGGTVTGPSVIPPPRAFLRPKNDIVRGNASTSSLVESSSAGLYKSNGVERRQSSRHAETMSRSASRRPQMECMSTKDLSNYSPSNPLT